MTFDLAQMIADREAGTPGEWTTHQGWSHIVCPIDHFARPYGGSVDKNRDRNNYAHIIARADHDRHGRGDNHANARRIARVPLLEAEIIRLTTRAAELVEFVQALGALPKGYCFCSRNRVGDESKTHEPECANLRAALSTPTEEPKT